MRELIDLKLSQTDKQIKCRSKVCFREEFVAAYFPHVNGFSFFNHLPFDYVCFVCRSEFIQENQWLDSSEMRLQKRKQRREKFLKSYMRTNSFIVQKVNGVCCVIGLENDDKVIYVINSALELS